MKWHRIYGVILRVYYITLRNLDRAVEVFYLPIIDIILWGITSQYFTSVSDSTTGTGRLYFTMILSGIVLWIIVIRIQGEVPLNILEDLWNKNLINMFASPLTFTEWMTGYLLWGVIKGMLSSTFGAILAIYLYHINIYSLGLYFVPIIFLLCLTGLWMGIIVSAIILRYGTRVQSAAWTTGFLIAPFSAIYYPVSILPNWAQFVSKIIPTSYVFEQMRQITSSGTLNFSMLAISLVLNLIYITLAVLLLRIAFKHRLNVGLLTLQS